VTNVDVVKQNVILHGPDLEANSAHGLKVGWGKWEAPLIDNPAYKGVWAPRKIKNPAYFEDKTPSHSQRHRHT
jgi:hypothetical protein